MEILIITKKEFINLIDDENCTEFTPEKKFNDGNNFL